MCGVAAENSLSQHPACCHSQRPVTIPAIAPRCVHFFQQLSGLVLLRGGGLEFLSTDPGGCLRQGFCCHVPQTDAVRRLVEAGGEEGVTRDFLTTCVEEVIPGVHRFCVFTEDFCMCECRPLDYVFSLLPFRSCS